MAKQFDALDGLRLLPLLASAVDSVADKVRAVRRRRSDGGEQVTPREVLALVDTVHAAMRPVAEAIVDLVVGKAEG